MPFIHCINGIYQVSYKYRMDFLDRTIRVALISVVVKETLLGNLTKFFNILCFAFTDFEKHVQSARKLAILLKHF